MMTFKQTRLVWTNTAFFPIYTSGMSYASLRREKKPCWGPQVASLFLTEILVMNKLFKVASLGVGATRGSLFLLWYFGRNNQRKKNCISAACDEPHIKNKQRLMCTKKSKSTVKIISLTKLLDTVTPCK